MPHRRLAQKGSFSGHLDELVKHFSAPTKQSKAKPPAVKKRKISVHQALFERAAH
jgi:hypothetical protein